MVQYLFFKAALSNCVISQQYKLRLKRQKAALYSETSPKNSKLKSSKGHAFDFRCPVCADKAEAAGPAAMQQTSGDAGGVGPLTEVIKPALSDHGHTAGSNDSHHSN